MTASWRHEIEALVRTIEPADARETQDREETLRWITSGADLVRVRKPDTPPMHLVAYAIPWDRAGRRVLMIDHRLSGLWLPPGGHVEADETPAACAIRELHEELAAVPVTTEPPTPVFLTVQRTVGSPAHDDVSLWFPIAVDPDKPFVPDPREIRSVRWLDFATILTIDRGTMEPHMHRFARKLRDLGML